MYHIKYRQDIESNIPLYVGRTESHEQQFFVK